MQDKKSSGNTRQNEFTAFIIKNNNQVIERKIKASKKFMYLKETYIIMRKCIFLKVINGKLQSLSIYREGNPKPYDFVSENRGLTKKELSKIYGEDLFNMLVKIQSENKMLHMLLIQVAILFMTALMFFKVWF